MKTISNSINSLKLYFGSEQLEQLSARWLDKYKSSLDDKQLCKSFETVFKEDASYFEIQGKAKAVAERLMLEFYHNEAFVKSAVISHLRRENNVTFFEMPLLDSRIDVCSVNGHSCAYEIKTKYDSFKRLNKQLLDYLKVFEMVYVICPADRAGGLGELIPDCVGIITYDDSQIKCKFSTLREAKRSGFIDSSVQISLLHKNEKTSISSFAEDSDAVNDFFKKCLKKRYNKKWHAFKKTCQKLNKLDYQYYFNLCS